MKILVPDNTELELDLPDDVDVVPFTEGKAIPEEHLDAEAVVAWGASPNSLGSMAKDMPNLRWVQSLSAGVDAFLAAGIPDRVILTTGRGLHDQTVSEHAVALLMSLARQLPSYFRAQENHEWLQDRRGPKPMADPERVSTLIDARVLIWGFGSIGQTLAPIMQALGAKQVRGVARRAGMREGFEVVDDVDQVLPETDVLVMILPSDEQTTHALNAERIALLPDRSIVVNVGRGTTVDEEALVAALREGKLAGAGLDVMEAEPLPEDSPLWDAPNTVLTPHVAGFRAHGAKELIESNFRAWRNRVPMRNAVPL